MQSLLSINDTDVSAGLGRLAVTNPPPPMTPVTNTLDVLIANQTELLAHVHRLEARITVLEARTWWSMLKDQWLSLWRRA